MNVTRGGQQRSRSGGGAITVRLPDGRVLSFSEAFHIGRDPDCEVQIQDVQVSRRHAAVSQAQGAWTIRDLQSSNGLFVDGERIETAPIGSGITVEFGSDGPLLEIVPAAPARTTAVHAEDASTDDSVVLDGYAERYLKGQGEAGSRTMMIRKAFQKVQQRQKRRHRLAITLVLLAAAGAGGFAYYEHQRRIELEKRAEDVFYRMKAFELDITSLEATLAQSGTRQGSPEVADYAAKRRAMEANYNQYVAGLYDRRRSEKERLILKVTRDFGECEIAAPQAYIKEVSRYIDRWKTTGRFARAVKLAAERGYTRRIAAEFQAQGLRPEYFYLAMQESDFVTSISGSPTRWGIAKGMWQFIPETGQRYGLAIGPLARWPVDDPRDERLDWEKSTTAATRYIKELYATDAQASGLLVMASYNWGEQRILDRVRQLPANPRERNFWQLLEKFKMPLQTYEYVFSIVSAAVIGENPRLFGFPFDNPLLFTREP